MTCEEAIAALQEAKNIFCATGSKGIILAKIKIKLKVLMCCDEEEGGATTTTTTTTSTTTTTTTSTSTSTTTVDESPGLRMVFNDIENMPAGITNPTDVSEWNAFYDLPTNGTPFTSAWVSGNQVTLVGGGAMTIRAQAFELDTHLLEIYDEGNVVVEILNSAFALSVITDATFDSAITVGVAEAQGAFMASANLVNISLANATTFLNYVGSGTFGACTSVVNLSLPSALLLPRYFMFGATSLETFNAPLATDLGSSGMKNCTSATLINIPLCVNLGANPADASVFDGITGQTITLNIAAVNATNNAGGVHASVAYLIANNTATVNYI